MLTKRLAFFALAGALALTACGAPATVAPTTAPAESPTEAATAEATVEMTMEATMEATTEATSGAAMTDTTTMTDTTMMTDTSSMSGTMPMTDTSSMSGTMPMTDTTAMTGTMGMTATQDIVETAMSAGTFNTLATALTASGLLDTLKGQGPFTVFAPSDAAFAALPAETLADLLKPENKDKLVKVLTYHVVPGRITQADLAGGTTTATSVEGSELTFTVDTAGAKVNDANIVQADIQASNGIIHVIDKVILPPDMP